ncbi:MAG TPA: DUF1707 domain-containing protein [Arachnia sp.]|nr:DUF1707 domain-containing protein [Arachnia sp.]HMT84880.1 DUF1707 domain-containing protein [Arachnia sp.]
MSEGQGGAQGIDHLRCADSDRELVADVLNSAYADGRLSFEEHADRIALAYDAKTYRELNALTHDLIAEEPPSPQPPHPVAPASYGAPARTAGVPPISPTISDGFRGGSAHLSSLRPGRIMLLDPVVRLNTIMGDIHLDLIDTTFSQAEIRIEVNVIMADIKIRVPAGVQVRTEDVNTVMGEMKVQGLVPVQGGVTLRLSGLVLMAEIKVFGPDMDERKYRRFIK